ncbi:hypothetical protein [Aestuariimicrobium sp. T2.26MG-19.2B]|uniref:hypothetical protein n=1 Tax=Aestuariimicrobium sp. T2.26MG-19.2B TaxID=3040679 RepID=UPI0024775C42|nr:hypothetical protein [Aestuariimicrobium sp. T2.26MG-19.2B]CAI9411685.1 hypothetical protein AESSP_02700 [Aestuariimicrobium sp. T2.26MG-19.2B]
MTPALDGQWPRWLQPYTYFRDTHGVISYYLGAGMAPLADGRVRAIAVYLPLDTAGLAVGQRLQPASIDPRDGMVYTKTAYQGRTYEHAQASGVASPDILAWLEENTVADLGGMSLGILPEDIVEIFDGREALQRLLHTSGDDPTSLFAVQADILTALHSAVDALERAGISPESLRLYGSLACGIRRVIGGVTDIDLVVDDRSAKAGITSICAGNSVVETKIQGWLRQDAKRFANAVRRGETSQFHVETHSGDLTQIDIRISAGSPLSDVYPRLRTYPFFGSRIASRGRIIDDTGGLSFPPTFIVACFDGVIRRVCSDYYQWIGAAATGDEVTFRGTKLGSDTVLLGDTPVDYLVVEERAKPLTPSGGSSDLRAG